MHKSEKQDKKRQSAARHFCTAKNLRNHTFFFVHPKVDFFNCKGRLLPDRASNEFQIKTCEIQTAQRGQRRFIPF
jgi:hypothetical protein